MNGEGIDFFFFLDENNCRIDESTNTYELLVPEIFIEVDFIINKSCNIISKCNTVIKSEHFEIKSHSVSFDGISFETSIRVFNCDNFQMTNCTIKNAKLMDGAIYMYESRGCYIANTTISETAKIPGIFLTEGSSAVIENVTLRDITETMIVCNSRSYMYLRNSELINTKANSIYVSNAAFAEINNCTLSKSEYPSIYIQKTPCRVINNHISNITQNSISFSELNNFVIAGNTIENVNASAIAIIDVSNGKVYKNKIVNAGGNGIYIYQATKIRVYKNTISNNKYPSLAILKDTVAHVFSNVLSNIAFSGVCVRGARYVKFEKSQISNAGECGISISDTKKCIISNNTFTNCKITAIESYNSSNVIAESNILDTMQYGFLSYAKGYIEACRNQLKDTIPSLAKLTCKGSGYFHDNDNHCKDQKIGDTAGTYVFENNTGFTGITNISDRVNDNVVYEEPFVDQNPNACLKCHEKTRNTYLLDCGHMVYCKECATQALNNGETCPLCRFAIASVAPASTSGDNICMICQDEKSDSIVIPCGHMGFCERCIKRWLEDHKICPICNQDASYPKKIVVDM